MPKKRVVTATKPMRFRTTFGTEGSQDRQDHAEEREAKRWLQTRLNNYEALARKYQPHEVDDIVLVSTEIRHTDMMKMGSETIRMWHFRYDGQPLVLAVKRML